MVNPKILCRKHLLGDGSPMFEQFNRLSAKEFIEKDEIEANKKCSLEIKKIQKLIKFNRSPIEVQEMKDRIMYLEMMIEQSK